MQQNARFIRKLPIPMDIKKEFPLSERVSAARAARVEEMRAILDGRFPADAHDRSLLRRPRGQRYGLHLPPCPPAGAGEG